MAILIPREVFVLINSVRTEAAQKALIRASHKVRCLPRQFHAIVKRRRRRKAA